METFAKRAIDVTITIGKGQYGEQPGDPVILSGYRVILSTLIYSTQTQGRMDCVIYGMPLVMMNQLTRIGWVGQNVKQSAIVVTAGNDGGQKVTVYQGVIWTAYADFSGVPEVPLVITALGSLLDAVKPVSPTSYNGTVDAATVLGDLAKTTNLSFHNDGVSVMLSNPYYPGTALDQFKSCAEAAQVSYAIEGPSVTIWPRGSHRKSDPVLISVETGMVGYPTFSGDGLELTVLFNPNLKTGGRATVVSTITPACGTWNIFRVSHSLASEMPNGPWFTHITCQRAEQSV